MEDNDRRQLVGLLTRERVGALAVLVDGRPYASLVPFAMTDDLGAALIHASKLARHSAGLDADAPFSLLIHEPDAAAESNPAQLARLTLEGRVRPYSRQEEAYSESRERYLAKFPKSRITFQLGDFTLYALQVESCRFVAGFAKTFDLDSDDLARLA